MQVTIAERDQSRWDANLLQRAVDAAGISLWTWNVDSDHFDMDERGFELWDVPLGVDVSFEHLSEKIHPEDRDRVREAFVATRAVVGPYEIDFRTCIKGAVSWISARGRGSDEDIVNHVMTGVFLDVTGRKQAEESSELLAGEMSHRVKNLLAIASGLASMTARTSSSIEDMTKQLTNRLKALGRAHDLVRPLPGQQGDAALLGDIFTVLLAPYDDQGAFAGRIRISVPRMGVGEDATEALALVVHELATNALKYGALSADEGSLDVSACVVDDKVRIVWTEQGGPVVAMPLEGLGYGSKLVRMMLEDQLGGTVSYDWSQSGVIVTLEVDGELLAR